MAYHKDEVVFNRPKPEALVAHITDEWVDHITHKILMVSSNALHTGASFFVADLLMTNISDRKAGEKIPYRRELNSDVLNGIVEGTTSALRKLAYTVHYTKIEDVEEGRFDVSIE